MPNKDILCVGGAFDGRYVDKRLGDKWPDAWPDDNVNYSKGWHITGYYILQKNGASDDPEGGNFYEWHPNNLASNKLAEQIDQGWLEHPTQHQPQNPSHNEIATNGNPPS